MIATIAAFAVLMQTPAAQDPASQDVESNNQAVALIGKILSHYYKAKRLYGTILLTTTAGKVSGKLQTLVQFDDPSKLYIRQDMQAATQGTWKIMSDGIRFSYPLPNTQLGSDNGKNLIESVVSGEEIRTFREIYAIGAGGLKDKSAPLDIALGRYEDLKIFRGHLATHKMGEPMELRGKQCQVVEGKWRIGPGAPAESSYRIVATPDGELMRYELTDKILNPDGSGGMMDIHQVWDVDLHLDGQTRDDLYVSG